MVDRKTQFVESFCHLEVGLSKIRSVLLEEFLGKVCEKLVSGFLRFRNAAQVKVEGSDMTPKSPPFSLRPSQLLDFTVISQRITFFMTYPTTILF